MCVGSLACGGGGPNVSTVYDSPDLPSCRRYQKAPLGASSGNHTKASRGRASRGHFELVWNSTSSAGTPSTRLRPMALSTGRVRFCTRACSSTASQARVREGGLRLTTVTGGPSTTGTQNLSSTCPRGPVDLVGLCCVCMPESWARPQQLSVMSVAVAQAASATHTRAGEQGVQARHGQFRMMCSCVIVPATPTSTEPFRVPATTRSWWVSLYRTRCSRASSS